MHSLLCEGDFHSCCAELKTKKQYSEKQNLSHKMKIVCQVLTNVLGKSLVFSFTKWLTNKFFVEKPRKLVAFGTVSVATSNPVGETSFTQNICS